LNPNITDVYLVAFVYIKKRVYLTRERRRKKKGKGRNLKK
jgi:predicted transcriptional regulator